MKRFAAVLMSLVMACVLFAGAATAESFTGIFEEWDPDAPALNALIEYVEDVTDEDSPDYIPPVDRIATFDMDGTLCGEL